MIARSDVVGSLLRPPDLIDARERLSRNEISQAAFKCIEDAAVDDAVRLQEAAGLAVLTDGEMRRLSFQSQLTESVDGFSGWDIDAFLWGRWRSDELGDVEIERPPISVVDTLRRKRFLSAEEFTYTRGRTDRIVKVTLPSPSLFANFWVRTARSARTVRRKRSWATLRRSFATRSWSWYDWAQPTSSSMPRSTRC